MGLTADTDLQLFSVWYDTRVAAGLVCLALLLRGLWVSSRRRASRPIAFGLAWFGLALVPASSVFPLAEVSNAHRVFFPYIGLVLAVVWGVALQIHQWCATWPHRRPLLLSVAWMVAVLVLGGHAWQRFAFRIYQKHVLREFSPLAVFWSLGGLLLAWATGFGAWTWLKSLYTGHPATTGTVMLSVLPFVLGFQLVLQAMLIEIQESTRH